MYAAGTQHAPFQKWENMVDTLIGKTDKKRSWVQPPFRGKQLAL